MIKEALDRIFSEYRKAKKKPFANHPLANFIRDDVPPMFAQALPAHSDMKWKGSPGLGNWNDAPWIAAFYPLVTESAQRGYYPVLLFNRSLSAVFLSMNQGVYELMKEYGVRPAKDILQHRAKLLRIKLTPEYSERFSSKTISLQPRESSSLLAMYEPGHAFGLKYRRGQVPPDEKVLADLNSMLELYHRAFALGGTAELDAEQQGTEEGPQTQDEIRRYKLHRSIDRNPGLARAAKRIHGYICQACGFDFEREYGELGHLYIEAHHLTPLSELPFNTPVPHSPNHDFAVVCGNCHRMIHRKNAPGTFREFANLVRQKRLELT